MELITLDNVLQAVNNVLHADYGALADVPDEKLKRAFILLKIVQLLSSGIQPEEVAQCDGCGELFPVLMLKGGLCRACELGATIIQQMRGGDRSEKEA